MTTSLSRPGGAPGYGRKGDQGENERGTREKTCYHLRFISLQPSPAADPPKFNSSACFCVPPTSWFGWRALSFLNLSACASFLLRLPALLPLPTFSKTKAPHWADYPSANRLLDLSSSLAQSPVFLLSFQISYSAEITEYMMWELNYTANSRQVPVSQCDTTAKMQSHICRHLSYTCHWRKQCCFTFQNSPRPESLDRVP